MFLKNVSEVYHKEVDFRWFLKLEENAAIKSNIDNLLYSRKREAKDKK